VDPVDNLDVTTTDSWPARMFSLSNAKDDRPDDLPHLLRRLADNIEALQVNPMNVLDLTVSFEMTTDGPGGLPPSTGRPMTTAIKEFDRWCAAQGRYSRPLDARAVRGWRAFSAGGFRVVCGQAYDRAARMQGWSSSGTARR
jgi:hypothetical protein